LVYACIFFQKIVMYWLTMDFLIYGLVHVKNTTLNVVHGVGLNIGNLSWQPTRVSNKAKRVKCAYIFTMGGFWWIFTLWWHWKYLVWILHMVF
jgi:hypothetical protein